MTNHPGQVIDVCVRHQWASPGELMEYMAPGWREFLTPLPNYTVPMLPPMPWPHPDGDKLSSSYPASGHAPGSDPGLLGRHILDRPGMRRVVLAHDAGRQVSIVPHPFLAREIARAANDWCIDRWLNGDDARIYSLVLVANQLPEEAAKEIRRVGHHDRMVGVLMATNGLGLGLGHPAYHPIYAAAAELGLPIVLHAGLDDSPNTLTQPTAGGPPMTMAEYRSLAFQPLETHLQSIMAQGVLIKHPGLKMLVAGAGAAWVAQLLWNMDTQFEQNGREVPWMTRRPSEYFRESVRVTTYPMNDRSMSEKLVNLLECGPFDVSEILCYASGWPQWDSDSIDDVAGALPESWHARVFHENAEQLYRWSRIATEPSEASDAVGAMLERKDV